MMVNMGGHSATGTVVHSVFGEWSYSDSNKSWCGVALSGNDSKNNAIEVTCKRCLKQTPEFSIRQRDYAVELLQAWRAGFDGNNLWGHRCRMVLDSCPEWKGSAVDLAKVILSSAKPV